MRLHAIICILLLTLMAGPAFSAEGQSSPEQCLNDIQSAVDTGDVDAFARLIDLDAILGQALDMFIAEASRPENVSQLPPMLAILFSQGAPDMIKGLLVNESRGFVLGSVASGSFAGKKFDRKYYEGMLAPLFADASTGRKEIIAMGTPEKVEGGWTMPFVTRDYGNGNDYSVVGRFTEENGQIRLTAIENLPQLFNQIASENQGN